MGSINSSLVRANTSAWGQKKNPWRVTAPGGLEAKTKTLSSQVQGSRSMTEGGADAPSIRLINSCLAYAEYPRLGVFGISNT